MSATTKRRWPKNALRVVLGVVAGLAATELAFWYRDAGAFAHVNCYVADPALGVRLRPGATETIRFGSEKNPVTSVRINAEGFRGDAWPPPSADEIVIVGDSQTFGLGVEEGETFAKVLQGALGDRRFVRNLGVPTYGPREYNAILAEQLDRRPAKTVIWVANVANDLFEASHPNTTRHAVWDGWAVRRESAPAHVTSFPGRSLLYTHSHAFLALRRWLYERGPQDSEAGSPTEGTWRDIGRASDEALEDHALAEHERARLAALHAVELEIAKDRAAAQTREVDQLVLRKTPYEELADHGDREDPRWISQEQTYLASRLSPGDIVTAVNGEVERDVRVNAAQIRRGVELRNRLEKRLVEEARRKHDAKILAAFDERDARDAAVAALAARPVPKRVVVSPLAPALKDAKAICDAHGARLIVVALPIDVQVAATEWAKYDVTKPIDMSATRVLNGDVIAAAEAVGADGFDALPALAAAEPGAFLDRDLHMSAKGHRAVGEALAKALAPGDKPGDNAGERPGQPDRAPEEAPGRALGGAPDASLGDDAPPQVVALARAALDASKQLAQHCRLHGYKEGDWLHLTENCGIFKHEEVKALQAARRALDASPLVPDAGFPLAFVTRFHAFEGSISSLWHNERGYWATSSPGTLERYQDLAIAWNAWRPDDVVAVDVGKPRDPPVPVGPEGHIEWRPCYPSVCVFVDLPKADH